MTQPTTQPAFKAGKEAQDRAYERQQEAKATSRTHRIERLRAKALTDPDGIWGELLEEALTS